MSCDCWACIKPPNHFDGYSKANRILVDWVQGRVTFADTDAALLHLVSQVERDWVAYREHERMWSQGICRSHLRSRAPVDYTA